MALKRNTQLIEGDVLEYDPDTNSAIVARIELSPVFVIDLAAIEKEDKLKIIQTCIELGHAIGNQHWPAVIKGYQSLHPAHRRQESDEKRHGHSRNSRGDLRVPGRKEVIPYLAPHEIRNLFGGTAQESHAHVHGDPECTPMYTLIPTGRHMSIPMYMTTNTITTINQYSICLHHERFFNHILYATARNERLAISVGNFSFSNGLETASYEKIVHDADTLSQYAHAASLQSAYSDGIAAIQAYRAIQRRLRPTVAGRQGGDTLQNE